MLMTPSISLLIAYLEDFSGRACKYNYNWDYKYPEPPSRV